MSTFTIFFCGTACNSYDFNHKDFHEGELIATLARNHPGVEFVDYIIVDGPGSGNLQEDIKWVKPGNYSLLLGQLKGWGWEDNVAHALAVLKREVKHKRDLHTKQEINILNRELFQNAENNCHFRDYGIGALKTGTHRKITPQALQEKRTKLKSGNTAPPSITQVNLVGWSRGGGHVSYDGQCYVARPKTLLNRG